MAVNAGEMGIIIIRALEKNATTEQYIHYYYPFDLVFLGNNIIHIIVNMK